MAAVFEEPFVFREGQVVAEPRRRLLSQRATLYLPRTVGNVPNPALYQGCLYKISVKDVSRTIFTAHKMSLYGENIL